MLPKIVDDCEPMILFAQFALLIRHKSTWLVDHTSYVSMSAFNRFKQAVANSLTLHYPDYELNWILRTDASVTLKFLVIGLVVGIMALWAIPIRPCSHVGHSEFF